SGKGDVEQTEKVLTEQTKLKILDPQGNALKDSDEKKTTSFVYKETILEKPDGKKKATRLSRHYDKAEVTKEGKAQTRSYQGKTVLIEKKDGKYHFSIEGGDEVKAEEAQELNKEFNKEMDVDKDWTQLMLPKKAVKVNESWKIDGAVFAKDLEKEFGGAMQIDAAKMVATGKLLKAHKK